MNTNSQAKILSIQFCPKIGDKMYNCNRIGQMICDNSKDGLDLVVMPEFFSTGIDDRSFIGQPEEESSSAVLAYFSQLARQFSTNIICGTVIEKAKDGKLYNTSYALDRKGAIVAKYRKIHLYNYLGGNEGKKICPGDTPVVVNFDFARVGMSVCFDIRYPLLYKNLIKMGAEIIVSPSAWCTLSSTGEDDIADFINCWRAFNISRAAENLVYFVTSNLIGTSNPYLYSIGNSMITDPLGKIIANAQNTENAIFENLNMTLVRKLKKEYPIYNLD